MSRERADFDVKALIAEARYDGPTVTVEQLVGVESCLRQLAGQLALVARPELAERFGTARSCPCRAVR